MHHFIHVFMHLTAFIYLLAMSTILKPPPNFCSEKPWTVSTKVALNAAKAIFLLFKNQNQKLILLLICERKKDQEYDARCLIYGIINTEKKGAVVGIPQKSEPLEVRK
jgi:hypothetical protein